MKIRLGAKEFADTDNIFKGIPKIKASTVFVALNNKIKGYPLQYIYNQNI